MTTEDMRRPSEVTDVDHIKAKGLRSTLCWDQCGRWLLTPLDIRVRDSEGDTQLDRAWFGVKKLVEQGVLYDSVCSTALLPDKNIKRGVITCYTPNCLKEIRRVADAIREVVDYGRDIQFKKYSGTLIGKCVDKDKNTVLYKHTPDGDLYVKDKDKWRLLIEDNGLDCENIVSVNSSKRPSEVKDEDYIWALNIAASTCTDSSKAGKWILKFKDLTKDANGATAADRAWSTVRDLVKKGQLPDSKCSTMGKHENKAVIVCYTADYTDVKEVWRVANMIRTWVQHKANFYYYPSSSPSNDKCQGKHSDAALYKHTENWSLYKNDAGTWAEISADTVNPPKDCLSSSSKRPSEIHNKSYIWALNKLGFPHVNNDKVGKWIIVFSDSSRNDEGATEADIAWAKVQELVNEGQLHDSKCSTAKLNRSKFVIVCYTPDCTDVGKLGNVANTIRSKVVHEEDIYYKLDCAVYYGTNTEGQNTAIYKHTKHCDLYKHEAGIWTEISIPTMVNQESRRADTIRPSEVTSERSVWAKRDDLPPYENDGRGGKWCIYLDKSVRDGQGDTALDKAWYEIERLVREGSIYDSKCSTALDHETATDFKGVIICYTPNHNDTADIKRVATAISTALKAVVHLLPFHYKTDDATHKGLYLNKGDMNIAKYRFNPNTGVMSIKTGAEWKNVDEREINDIVKSITLKPVDVNASLRPQGWGTTLKLHKV